MALVLNDYDAQSEAIQRGLSYDDFLWEFPSHHETRIVRSPSAQTDTPLRALRLDISIRSEVYTSAPVASLYIGSIELNLTSITRSPSLSNNLASCTLRLDTRYTALANTNIQNHSSQIVEIPTDSQSNERVITTSGPIHVNGTVQMMGDMFAAPIYGGNVRGQNNINNITSSPILNTMASAVVSAIRSEIHGERSFVPPTEGGRNRRRARARHDDEAGIDVEPPRKRRTRQSRA